jgi:predicted 2-oxoglutarate/Fe(II)-dependent dioxygenase YbiX
MAEHCDHIHDMFDGIKKGIPILTVIGLLNSEYTGGEFIILEDEIIDLQKGDIVIFPSLFLYPHKVNPVTSGVRYSFATWIW